MTATHLSKQHASNIHDTCLVLTSELTHKLSRLLYDRPQHRLCGRGLVEICYCLDKPAKVPRLPTTCNIGSFQALVLPYRNKLAVSLYLQPTRSACREEHAVVVHVKLLHVEAASQGSAARSASKTYPAYLLQTTFQACSRSNGNPTEACREQVIRCRPSR